MWLPIQPHPTKGTRRIVLASLRPTPRHRCAAVSDFLEDISAALLVRPLLRDREVMIDLCGFPQGVVAVVLYALAFPTPELLGHHR